MTLETNTLVDRTPLPMTKWARRTRRSFNWLALFQGSCFVLIECLIFAASTLLLVLGLPLFVFLLLAGWDLTTLFAQLGNLADHYRSAEPIARHLFSSDLQIALLICVGTRALIRMPSFLHRLDRRLNESEVSHG